MPLLQVPRGRKPLSLWDWKVWPLAKPHLWRYGDASNLYYDEDLDQGRQTYLTSQEWMACLLTREEMGVRTVHRGRVLSCMAWRWL